MGLEGTLRAFSVADILQVLGLQKKTGVLTVRGKEDTITVSFLGGHIVSADSTASSLEERFGTLLVKTGKLAPELLDRAMETRKQTRQRLSVLLLGDRMVSPEDLREALRLQISRIVLGSLRWSDGEFRFSPEGVIDRDGGVLPAIPTETFLKEAVRILDETPRVEKKIPSRDLVFRRAAGVERLRLVVLSSEAGDGALQVSRREAETWKWVDGKRPVAEILDRAFLSDLDVYRGLADLLDRNLITLERVQLPDFLTPVSKSPQVSVSAIGLWVIVALLIASAVRELPRNRLNLLVQPSREWRQAGSLLSSISLARLATIERAVRVYYDATGRYPRSIEDLLTARVLDRHSATDPYGRPYRYILQPEEGKFSLYGRNAAGEIDLDLVFERSLAPVSEQTSQPRRKPVGDRPGIQVVQ